MNHLHKIIILFIFTILLFPACENDEKKLIIEGEITSHASGYVYLSYMGSEGVTMLDSVKQNRDQFRFVLPEKMIKNYTDPSEPAFYKISVTPENSFTTIGTMGEILSIKADARSLVKTYHITGGKDASLMEELDQTLKSFIDTVDLLYAFYSANIEDDSVRSMIETQYNVLVDQHTRNLKVFIEKHSSSLASIIAFYQQYNRRRFIDEKENIDLLQKICTDIKARYPDNEHVAYLEKRIQILKH